VDATEDDAPREALEPGRIVGRNFRVERLLGEGAMGQVYLAEQLSLSKKVAIKVLHRHLARDPALAKRFQREAKSASQLDHPNSIQIIDFGQDEDGALFIAMELLDGRDLGKVIRADFPLPLARIGRIMGQVFAALDEAHVKGVIHRDLKPENIMVVDRRGEPDFVKVCDFGIAKIQDPKSDAPESVVTMAGVVCGTPEFMSPEQARGETLDGRTDLYAAAVILYQMATGELPFTAGTALGVVTKHLTDAPVPPRQRRPDLDIDPALEALILRGLAKDRTGRPESALAFRQELEAVVAGAPARGVTDAAPAAAVATAPTLAATPSVRAIPPTRQADAVPRGGATRIALVAGGGVLVVALIVAALILGRGAPRGPAAATTPPDAGPGLAHRAGGDAAPAVAPGARDAAAVTATRPDAAARERAERPRAERPHHERKPEARTEPKGGARPAPRTARTSPGGGAAAPAVKAALVRGFAEVLDEAEKALKGGKVRDAVKLFEEARRLGPRNPRVHRALGKLYMSMGRVADAKQAYRRYLELAPKAADAEFIRGILDQ
jgi:tRNA A-37 threonylcarbamoyl transferase component Bud32